MKKSKKMSAFSRRYCLRYAMTMLIPLVAAAMLALLAQWICGFKIWYQDEKLYMFFTTVKENLLPIVLIIVIICGVFTTIHFIRKPLEYMDDVVDAAKGLSSPKETPIELPAVLYDVEQELNSARETALRNDSLAREADKRKNDMIVYLAHDLKTPLTSVIGYLSLLSDEPQISEENRKKYTAVALERSQRLEILINEFFDITRFSLTSLTLEEQRIDLSLMLNQTLSEFEPILSEQGLAAKAEIQPNVSLLCDPDKLERVFDNLLRNAASYAYPDTEIKLSMSADDKTVTVICENSGRTIPREKLDRIFEQFFRADSARSSKTGGAGLGLAIAKEIVTLHGGEISAFSENERVVFTVKIPRK